MKLVPATLAALLASSFAGAFPAGDGVLGVVRTHRVAPGESLIEIARAYDLGYREIAAANPDLDPFVPGTGATVTVPTAWILPSAAEPGSLIVNLSEMRLYYVVAGGGEASVVTFPVGIGAEGAETPLGAYRVVEKVAHPAWYPPRSIREEDPDLPPVVPPGPENPLGTHALRLSHRSILIHGTNRPWGVGRRASHGCIRLYPEDIVQLYGLVRVGTPVLVVREPVKAAVDGERIYVEVHADVDLAVDYVEEAWQVLARKGLLGPVDRAKLTRGARERSGIPVDVSP
jgi:L,D-transpeptidase ErfK/SrfK